MTIIYTQYVIVIYILLYAPFIGFLIRTYTLDLNNWNNGFIICRGFCTSFVTNTWYVTGCDVYTYGLDCKRCGTCRGGVQCDHVTGTCPNGCYPGMYGNECDRGNFRITFAFSKKKKKECNFLFGFFPSFSVSLALFFYLDVGKHV